MYLLDSLPSPEQIPLWGYLVYGLISVSAGLLTAFFTRKKSSSVRAEDNKTAAEAFNLNVKSISELLEDLRAARAESSAIAQEAANKAEEGRKRESFLRDQLVWHEEHMTLSRKAAHAAINEVQRCIWAIHLRDEALRALQQSGIEFEPPPPFEQIQYEEIVKYQSLPLPPQVRKT